MGVLVGWCTLHALIYLAVATAVFWLVQLAVQVLAERPRRRPQPTQDSRPRVPHWARNGHLPPSPSSSAAKGRHRRGGTP